MRLDQAGEGYSADGLTTQGDTKAHAKQARKMPRAATRVICSSSLGFTVEGRSGARLINGSVQFTDLDMCRPGRQPSRP